MKNNNSKLAILGGEPLLRKTFPIQNYLGEEEKTAVMKVMKKRVISDFLGRAGEKFLGGEYVKEFEKDFCEYFKVKHAVTFNSASTALQAAVTALGIGPGDEVITTPYTISATATAILWNNAIPVFADLDKENYSMDVNSIVKRISKRTKAILLVNIFGGANDFSKIIPVAKKYKLKVIEDNAQAIGGKYKDKYLGTIGDIGVFSLNVHKTLQCGEGGVLVTNNDNYTFRAQLTRNHAEVVMDDLAKKNIAFEPIIGNNFRLSELHAAIAIEQLKKINILTNPRIKLADYLTREMSKFQWLSPAKEVENSVHVYYIYPFQYKSDILGIKRSTFAKAMASEGFPVYEGYTKPLYLMPIYQNKRVYPNSKFPFVAPYFSKNVSYKKGICPNVEQLYEKELLFTNICHYPRTAKDIDLFIQALRKIELNIDELKKYEKGR